MDQSNRLCIFVVDDNVSFCRGLARTLEDNGFTPHYVHSATDALRHISRCPVDLMLLDWILPDRDGVALLQHLRDRGFAFPVIVLTGRDSIQGRVRAFDRGADDYLAKPFATAELIARLKAHIRRNTSAYPNFRAGRITINTLNHEVAVDSVRVDLTPIEYAILSHLARNADELVASGQLVQAIWAHRGAGGSSKALDVQLTRLRRKLGPAAAQIERVRGLGIRLKTTEDAAD